MQQFFLPKALPCLFIAASCSANTPDQSKIDCISLRDQTVMAVTADLLVEDAEIPGVLGACVGTASGLACANGDQPLAMQSVMKLLVAIAAFEQVDAGALALDDMITVKPADLSVEVQPLAKIVLAQGAAEFTVLDLIRRMVTESDSAATDLLIERLGGPKAVEALVLRHVPGGIRLDRYERELQTELSGLAWQPGFVDPETFAAARSAVSPAQREAARLAATKDPRDRATPRALAHLLAQLAEGKLLSPQSTKRLLAIMEQTRTFPDRLKAGVPGTWRVAHKTGTSRTVSGITATTADVGILTAPDGTQLVAVALLEDSAAPAALRAQSLADVARLADRYHTRLAAAACAGPGR
jgi:beta-lactamase class A